MIHDPIFYLVSSCAILLMAISKSGFGSGLGVLAVPIMSLIMPPAQAAAIMLPLLCVMDIFIVVHYRKKFDRNNLYILVPAAIIGIILGTITFRYLSDAHIRILIGILAVLFALNYFIGQRQQVKQTGPSILRGGIWGTVAGFTSFGVHAGGPPVSVYLLPQRLDKTIFVGTMAVLLIIINYIKLVPYYFLGQLNGDNLSVSLVLAPLAPLGAWMGIKLHDRVNEKLFYNLAYFFLFITGIKLLYDGFTTL